jgi:hypothetical protein
MKALEHLGRQLFYQAQLFVQDMADCSKLHHMGVRKLLDSKMAASCNGRGHRDDNLVCQGKFS